MIHKKTLSKNQGLGKEEDKLLINKLRHLNLSPKERVQLKNDLSILISTISDGKIQRKTIKAIFSFPNKIESIKINELLDILNSLTNPTHKSSTIVTYCSFIFTKQKEEIQYKTALINKVIKKVKVDHDKVYKIQNIATDSSRLVSKISPPKKSSPCAIS